jgi:hypothetical protein
MVRIYMKMLTISLKLLNKVRTSSCKRFPDYFDTHKYKFKAAKMYSSGLIEYLCFPPIINWVS